MTPAFPEHGQPGEVAPRDRPAEEGGQKWRERLFGAVSQPSGAVPTWPALITALFLSFVVLTLPVPAPDLGADSGWSGVLNWAHDHGAQFGTDLIFTYGPLGYLVAPYCLTAPSNSALTANMALCLVAAAGLCLSAWRLGRVWRTGLLCIFIFESANVEARADLMFEIGFLCWGLLCVVENESRRKMSAACLVALAVFGSLAKVSYVFIGGFSISAISLCFYLSGDKRLSLGMLAGFAAAVPLAWVLCGQALQHLGGYLSCGFVISREYDQAAGLAGLPMLRMGGLVLGATAVASVLLRACDLTGFAGLRARLRHAAISGWLLGLVFLVWKHSMVRVDRYHIIELAVFTPVLALLVEFWPNSGKKFVWGSRGLGVISCLASWWILESAFLPGLAPAIAQPFRQFAYHLRCVFSPSAWRSELRPAFEDLKKQAQLPRLQETIGTASVDVFGSLQSYALLNGMNYRPRPVFQGYVAYSARLARLNEEFLLSSDAPDFVLFELSSFEHRFPVLDDGPALRALLINYRPAAAEGPFLLLKRGSTQPAKMTLLKEGTVQWNENIKIAEYSQENLWLEVSTTPSLLGRVAGWLIRPETIRLSAWSRLPAGWQRLSRGRAPDSLLRVGFIASPCVLNIQDVKELYEEAARAIRPAAYRIEREAGSERFWRKDIHYRVYHIENRLGGPRAEMPASGP
jgi:hypothetical protein